MIWEREQDLYGNSHQGFAKENFRCPFKYQGQYYDNEVELCYNRFRYYHTETGRYISEDPIKLLGGFNVFAYVGDTNAWVDLLGLTRGKRVKDLPKNLQRRPKWRKETKDYLYENSEKTEDGKYISAKTGKPIEPGDEIIGHQNQSWREYQEATENQNKTRREVIDDYNDLSNLGFEDKRESSSDGGKYRGYEH
nr:RHS repeat-associated core domain-containing protein [Capnocytophaga bilenii]